MDQEHILSLKIEKNKQYFTTNVLDVNSHKVKKRLERWGENEEVDALNLFHSE